ncbi:MAG: hypothetical protein AAF615_01180 [Pseudomonadota bacterium]
MGTTSSKRAKARGGKDRRDAAGRILEIPAAFRHGTFGIGSAQE